MDECGFDPDCIGIMAWFDVMFEDRGAPLPYIHTIESWTQHVSRHFMRCRTCLDEYREMKRRDREALGRLMADVLRRPRTAPPQD